MAEEPREDSRWTENLQFDRAEYEAPFASGSVCPACNHPMAGSYYEVNGSVLCGPCHEGLQAMLTGGGRGRRFMRALLFGLGSAALGAGLYFGVAALTGYELG